MAKMAEGIADDLATTLILATDKPVMAVPAMNVKMWEHAATQRNVAALRDAGVQVLHPDEGTMACGEFGYGRLPEPEAIWRAIAAHFGIAVPEPAQAYVVEALEPEEELESAGGGLGGLLSRIIPRSTPKRSHEEAEAEFLETEELDDPADFPPVEEIEFNPDLGGGLLASKGGASAAPPVDPDAINHEVDERKSAPEIIEPPVAETPEAEPEAKPEPKGKPKPAAPAAAPVVAEVESIVDDALGGQGFDLAADYRPLRGRHVLVTAGPTWEAIDPVRYIANRSSGKQGFAIAAAASALGAKVTLVAGPVSLRTPPGVQRIDVESASEMAKEVKNALPADVAVMVAAVADWRPKTYQDEKIKKRGSAPPALMLTENPDILSNVAGGKNRPELVIGFAAETEDVIANGKAKRKRKAADWIIANDVSGDVMGGDKNRVHIISAEGVETLDQMPKSAVAMALAERIAATLTAEAAE
jgi:phosphopantothenoylcysteine decarboxylase/phosphopantothenate--cysteine ligase